MRRKSQFVAWIPCRSQVKRVETRGAKSGVWFLGVGMQRAPPTSYGVWERAVSSAGSGAEPQPKLNLVHFSLKKRIWYLLTK